MSANSLFHSYLVAKGSDALDHAVDVGNDNQYVNEVHDARSDPSLSDMDPLTQHMMLEEMDPFEALLFIQDLFKKSRSI